MNRLRIRLRPGGLKAEGKWPEVPKKFGKLELAAKAATIIIVWGGFAGVLIQPIRSEAHSLNSTIQYDDGIPKEIKDLCDEIGDRFNICPELLEAMAYNESRFIPTVTNKNCYGLMQINVKVHADRIEKYDWTAEDMFDPEKNITIAADYLAELFDTYGDDDPIVLSIYSGNWDAVAAYKESGQLTPYVNKVLTRSANYERLHGK